MKRHGIIATAVAAVAATGCAPLEKLRFQQLVEQPTKAFVVVAQAKNRPYIVVDREPILAQPGQTIEWSLIGQPGVTFDTDGIKPGPRVKPEPAPLKGVKCEAGNDQRTVFRCTLPADLPSGSYAYVVRLRVNGDLVELDPTWMVP